MLAELRTLDRSQWSAVIASFLGWTLDAFDFFLMLFMVDAIATEFHSDHEAVFFGVTLTLAARPFGALLFGWLADRFGRRPILMIDILLFSVFEFASAFAPSLVMLLIIRTLFGFAMGGEWGIGASLVMESIPAKTRGIISGLLQEGYACGYLLAAIAYYFLFDAIGWRGMFMIGIVPALLVVIIRLWVKESPSFEAARGEPRANPIAVLLRHWKTTLYVVVLMTAFNFFSHGTQDVYPTFLKSDHHFDTHQIGLITAIMNVGAITGGLLFGALSDRFSRRWAIIGAALLALPVIPLWAFSHTAAMLALGAFLIQVAVQGAWGVVPAHINELAPDGARGMFPGFAYQAGNFIASINATWQASLARQSSYSHAMALVCGVTAVVLVVWTFIGPERKGAELK
ncbi:MFS transporter [Sphingomonas abietis]|uniref:MFS transporter n=1 Tax=Sphingomonas abietis TaxID=3012344 RepID=A0ABY7NPJ2_9SPHN|nr:MFS transporter [Sphingomonas abietis]WBO22710.1 MFS transporter [Sphingomonas abietis]